MSAYVKLAALLYIAAALSGCCTYHGKAVSRSDAERMRNLGMDVHCPGEARIVNGQYREPFFPPACARDKRQMDNGRWWGDGWRFWK